jgi:hypothetical protein
LPPLSPTQNPDDDDDNQTTLPQKADKGDNVHTGFFISPPIRSWCIFAELGTHNVDPAAAAAIFYTCFYSELSSQNSELFLFRRRFLA